MKKIVKTLGQTCFRALGYYPARIKSLKFKLDPYHIPFWRGAAKGAWEPNTYTILSKFLNPDSVYCDVGAWIGPTVIYAAKICKQVICFEPNPFAYRYLRWNIELNNLFNVRSFNIALADSFAIRKMSKFGREFGDSRTSLLDNAQKNAVIETLTLKWDTFIDMSQTEKIDFLKIDIEGGEFELLPTLKNYLSLHKPIVYLSTHAPFLDIDLRKDKMQQVIEIMGMYKKCLNEDLTPIDIQGLKNEEALNSFHSYVFMD